MKVLLITIIVFVSSTVCYSQKIPKAFKHNWIAIVHNANSESSFDSLSLKPDNDEVSTGKFLCVYWVYHGKNKFSWGFFDKSRPGTELNGCNYEKWKLIGDNNVLRIRNCQTKDKAYYDISYNYDKSNNIKSITLKPSKRNAENTRDKIKLIMSRKCK